MHFPMDREIEAPLNHASEEVYIKDLEGLKKKLAIFRKDGKEKLQILTDFDYTLTKKMTFDGQKADNSFKALENNEIIGEAFSIGCSKARDKYIPIEGDPLLSKEEKEKYMLEWWKLTQNLMIETRMTKELIRVFFCFLILSHIKRDNNLIACSVCVKAVPALRVL